MKKKTHIDISVTEILISLQVQNDQAVLRLQSKRSPLLDFFVVLQTVSTSYA